MEGISFKIAKSLIFFLAAVILLIGITGDKVFGPAYVPSGSMEPAIPTGSVVFVFPAKNIRKGDVIVFRPLKIDAPRVAHRVAGITAEGFLTMGDASLGLDQEIEGELPVARERVEGKVLALNGFIPHIKGAHYVVGFISKSFGFNKWLLIFFLLAGGSILAGLKPLRERKARRRIRVRHLYLTVSGFCITVFMLSLILGTGVKTVNYNLPAPRPGQVYITPKVAGILNLKIHNRSLIPAFHFIDPLYPFTADKAPQIVPPLSVREATLYIRDTGNYGRQRAYIRVYHYPAVFPYDTIVMLQARSPYLVVLAMALFFSVVLLLFYQAIDGWVPLQVYWRKKVPGQLRAGRYFPIGGKCFVRKKWGGIK